jgi:hypothetical protein
MRLTHENAYPVNGVSALGGVATVDVELPERGKLHYLDIVHMAGAEVRSTKAEMLAKVVMVELFNNTRRIRELPIAEIFEDMERIGGTVHDGIMRIHFSQDDRNLSNGQDATALLLSPNKEDLFTDRLSIKITLAAAVTPSMLVRLRWEKIDNAEHANIISIRRKHSKGVQQIIASNRRDTVNITKTGVTRITLKDEGRNMSWLHMRTTDMLDLAIYRGNEPLWRGTVADFENDLVDGEYVLQAGVLSFSPEMLTGGRFGDIYQYRGKPLHIDANMGVAASFVMRVDEIGDVPR